MKDSNILASKTRPIKRQMKTQIKVHSLCLKRVISECLYRLNVKTKSNRIIRQTKIRKVIFAKKMEKLFLEIQ